METELKNITATQKVRFFARIERSVTGVTVNKHTIFRHDKGRTNDTRNYVNTCERAPESNDFRLRDSANRRARRKSISLCNVSFPTDITKSSTRRFVLRAETGLRRRCETQSGERDAREKRSARFEDLGELNDNSGDDIDDKNNDRSCCRI